MKNSEYVFSAKNNAFFPAARLDKYLSNGWDLTDAVDIGDEKTTKFMQDPPAGKLRAVGEDNQPCWTDKPALSPEEVLQEAEMQKQQLIDQANALMNSKQWPGKAVLGRLKGDELNHYNLWLDYLDAVNEVDTSTSPDILWPEKPE